ncbi:MAG: outer membrane protein assembly factor BamE, partial [Rhodospirillaceae bacterium]
MPNAVKTPRSRFCAIAFAVGLGVMLSACSKDIEARGNEPRPSSMENLEIGKSTRADAQAILGTPSATSMFG